MFLKRFGVHNVLVTLGDYEGQFKDDEDFYYLVLNWIKFGVGNLDVLGYIKLGVDMISAVVAKKQRLLIVVSPGCTKIGIAICVAYGMFLGHSLESSKDQLRKIFGSSIIFGVHFPELYSRPLQVYEMIIETANSQDRRLTELRMAMKKKTEKKAIMKSGASVRVGGVLQQQAASIVGVVKPNQHKVLNITLCILLFFNVLYISCSNLKGIG